jgi:hypothetical protein
MLALIWAKAGMLAGRIWPVGIAQESRGRADLELGAVVAGALNGSEHGVELA